MKYVASEEGFFEVSLVGYLGETGAGCWPNSALYGAECFEIPVH